MLDMFSGLRAQGDAAKYKAGNARRLLLYLVSSMAAGAFVGIGVVLMVSTAGPFAAVGDPATKLVSGAVFGIALTLVIYVGGELSTSGMMVLTQGALTRKITWSRAGSTLIFSFVGNLLGAMLLAVLVVTSGVLISNAEAGQMLAEMLAAKSHESTLELFSRAILCNVLVCLGIWACGRLKSESAKAIILFWVLLAFIASGFEHVVANMTTFSIGLIAGMPETNWLEFGRNMLIVGTGNLVGGALIVGVGLAIAAGWRWRVPIDTAAVDAEAR
ncbi:MAG: formate/nitrite transporter family protein [Beutenbergiaceae bacterium]